MPTVRVKTCPRADLEHARSRRQYAHVFHHPGVICVARAFWQLPLVHRRGLIAHELGHLVVGPRAHSEAAADQAAARLGLPVRYRDTRWGQRLQTL